MAKPIQIKYYKGIYNRGTFKAKYKFTIIISNSCVNILHVSGRSFSVNPYSTQMTGIGCFSYEEYIDKMDSKYSSILSDSFNFYNSPICKQLNKVDADLIHYFYKVLEICAFYKINISIAARVITAAFIFAIFKGIDLSGFKWGNLRTIRICGKFMDIPIGENVCYTSVMPKKNQIRYWARGCSRNKKVSEWNPLIPSTEISNFKFVTA